MSQENRTGRSIKTSSRRPQKSTVSSAAKSRSTKDGKRRDSKDKEKKSIETVEPKSEGAHLSKDLLNKLSGHSWYHGLMPRDEIEKSLKYDGDFLVRKTDTNGIPKLALSVINKGRIRHILISNPDNQWCIRIVRRPTLAELIEHHLKEKIPVQADGTLLVEAVPRPAHIILHDHVRIFKKLGAGAFGEVHMGVLKIGEQQHEVAIKLFRGNMLKKERAEFLKEFNVMRRFNHKNTVKVFGVATQEEPLMLILELCPGGALNSYLKKNPKTPTDMLVEFAKDACRGMCYLSVNKVIHRDIAARNCLLGDKNVVKISDFGLSVINQDQLKVDKLKRVPFRWLSPETLKSGVFSTKSDVWSFGILMWEIFSRCATDPYPNEATAEQVRARVLSGKELPAPDGSPSMIAIVMKLCFTMNPDQRPEFETLLKLLSPGEKPPTKETDQAPGPDA